MDNKFYVAVSFVGIEGIPFDQIWYDYASSAQEEESKNENPDESFKIKFQNLLLRSNKQNEDSFLLEDNSQIASMSKENY